MEVEEKEVEEIVGLILEDVVKKEVAEEGFEEHLEKAETLG